MPCDVASKTAADPPPATVAASTPWIATGSGVVTCAGFGDRTPPTPVATAAGYAAEQTLWGLRRPMLNWLVELFGVVVTAGAVYLVPAIKGLNFGTPSWIGFGLNGAWGLVAALLLDLIAKKRLG